VGPSPREPEALRHLLEADGGCFRPCGRRSGAPFRKDIVTGVGAKQILARRPVRYPRSSCSSRRGRKRGTRSSSNDPAGRGIVASPYRTHSTDASSAGRGAAAGFGGRQFGGRGREPRRDRRKPLGLRSRDPSLARGDRGLPILCAVASSCLKPQRDYNFCWPGQSWTGQNWPVGEPPRARAFYRVRS
jgi:hypothetical protein